MNYFSPKEAAERYALGRPDFHSNTIQEIKKYLRLEGKVAKALDIACGTGLSTKALLPITEQVFGTDASEEMLKHAHMKEQIQYSIARAEKQPFEDDTFNLITVSSGIHWFDIDAFLEESQRIIIKKGWLIVYDNFFTGEITGDNRLKDWYQKVYLKKFPAPPRKDSYDWSQIKLKSKGFQYNKMYTFKNEVEMNLESLVLYFTTQSNITNTIENQLKSYEEVENWLTNELNFLFSNDSHTILIKFSNWMKFNQKI